MAAQVIVPDVTELSKAVANGNLVAAQLVKVDGTGVQTNQVVSQSPAPGTLVAVGSSVTVNYGATPASVFGKGVVPTVLTTTPTVNGGHTYDQWRLVSVVIADGSPDVPLSDKFTLGTPYSIVTTLQKGRWTPDGNWEDSPVDQPVASTIPDVMKLAVSDAVMANYVALIAGYLANTAKTQGLI